MRPLQIGDIADGAARDRLLEASHEILKDCFGYDMDEADMGNYEYLLEAMDFQDGGHLFFIGDFVNLVAHRGQDGVAGTENVAEKGLQQLTALAVTGAHM